MAASTAGEGARMAKNALREMTGHRRVKLGHIVAEFATPGIGHILKSAGCDYVFFDMEHSGFSMETVKSAIRYFEAADLPVLLRAPSQDYHFIARAMDMGVEAFMAPMVSTVEQARHIVDRKSTRLNSSHSQISYAVFCLKKKKKTKKITKTKKKKKKIKNKKKQPQKKITIK